MYIKGITDYSREGAAKDTGLFAGPVTQDGELRQTQNGKIYGTASVRAFNRKDGSPVFMTLKTFSEVDANRLSAVRKGDRILAAGSVETREHNGKQYTDMMVDFFLTSAPADNLQLLQSRLAEAGGFTTEEEECELPF